MAHSSPYTPRISPPHPSMEFTGDHSEPHAHSNPAHPPTDPASHPDQNTDPNLDMDIMHDFGEGVGVDMRDFPSHSEQEGDEVGAIADSGVEELHKQSGTHLAPNIITTSYPDPPAGKNEDLSAASVNIDDMFKAETGLDDDDDDDEGEDVGVTPSGKRARSNQDVPGGFTYVDKEGESGRRKIRIEYIGDKSRRHITFSKRKAGIMKKAYESSILTGTQVLSSVVSETGLVYTFTTTKLQPLVQKPEGKNSIQACSNAPDGFGPDGQPLGGPVPATKAKNGGLAIRPHKLTPSASAALAASAQAASASHGHVEDHQQPDPTAALGHGTPSSARPKKRMPSGKGKKAQAAAAAELAAQQHPGNTNGHPNGSGQDLAPPVPPIPDMHRQASPHSAPGTIMPGTLASPMSAGYHIPPEYHHQSPTNPTFGYPGGPGDYQGGYYAPPPGQGHPHHQYLGVQGPPGGHMYSPDGRDRRMMVDSQGRSMGMGM